MQVTVRGRLFPTPNQAQKLNDLMRKQSACIRFAYNRLCEKLSKSVIEATLKQKFPRLNSRYRQDAYARAKANYRAAIEHTKSTGLLSPEKIVFGKRKRLRDRERGILTQQEWRRLRNNQLYSRGDKSVGGNQNLRFLLNDGQLHLRVNVRKQGWIYIPAYLANHVSYLLSGKTAYSVRILRLDGFYELRVSYEEAHSRPQIGFQQGAIGLDFNHNTIDLAVTNKQGQLKTTYSIDCHALTSARQGKRAWLIGNLAKQIMRFAKYWGRGLVLEQLRDVARGSSNQHMFTHRRFLNAVIRRSEREGVAIKTVNPAFTSVIGQHKYASYYHITVHQAAALVIARRGQGFRERLRGLKTLVLEPMEGGKPSEQAPSRRVHAWSLWRKLKHLQRCGGLPSRKGTGHQHPGQSPETIGVESQGTGSPIRSSVCGASDGKTAIPGSGPTPQKAT